MPLRALLTVTALVAALAAGYGSDVADAKQRFAPGLVSTDDHELSALAAGKLGARVVSEGIEGCALGPGTIADPRRERQGRGSAPAW